MSTPTVDGTAHFASLVTEREFSDAVVEYARLRGWLVHRDPTWRATGADPGYPDLTLARNGRQIFAKLKLDKHGSRLSAAQQAWLAALASVDSANVLVTVWRPSNWEQVIAVLR